MALKKASAAILVLIIAAVSLAIATSGVLSVNTQSQNLPSGGTLTPVQAGINIGIYGNPACTQNASFVDWGALKAGDNALKIVYIKNLGTNNATLSLSTTGWTPANAYPAISLSWNQEGRSLAPNEVIQATLTLIVAANIDSSITSFNFNIRITGTA
jgi:hypothetical protein